MTRLRHWMVLVVGVSVLWMIVLIFGIVLGKLRMPNQLVYTHRTSENIAIIWVDMGTRLQHSIYTLSGSVGTNIAQLTWSHDGRWLAFIAADDFQNNLYVFDFTLYPHAPYRLTQGLNNIGAISWSADSNRLLYHTQGTNTDETMYAVEIATGLGHSQAIDSGLYAEFAPTWSPIDDRIAFVSDSGGTYDLYTVQPDGQALTRWTSGFNANWEVFWSPDGQQLLFSTIGSPQVNPYFGNNYCRQKCLFVIDTRTGSLTPLTDLGLLDEQPAWSPDGQRIAFVSDLGAYNPFSSLYIIQADGTQADSTGVQPLIDSTLGVTSPLAWSLDGKALAFTSTTAMLYVVNTEDHSLLRFSEGESRFPAWRPRSW